MSAPTPRNSIYRKGGRGFRKCRGSGRPLRSRYDVIGGPEIRLQEEADVFQQKTRIPRRGSWFRKEVPVARAW